MVSVLFVSDDPDLLRSIALDRSYDLTPCVSAEAALVLVQERFDLIVSDGGIALLGPLRSAGDQTPFILLSDEQQVCAEGLVAGADLCLCSGGDPDTRIQILQRALHLITDRQRQVAAQQVANATVSSITARVRHDILNQIMVLSGYAELLHDMVPDQSAQLFLEKIEKAAETINRNITFTRSYQDLGAGEARWQSLAPVLIAAAKQAGSGVTLDASAVGEVSLFAEQHLPEVCAALFSYAVIHRSPVTLVRLTVERTSAGLVLVWEDDGLPIPEKDRNRLLEYGYLHMSGYDLFLAVASLSVTGITLSVAPDQQSGARFQITVPYGVHRG
ncbi:hybrid sensor histidine kinase/response regulator [Methanosphaerula palustris]|uniref:histidine kinase n=1 Tax=Methanosphaerula palustris (strain ATCC BAA-1556 / DSM 19958 / E1-9c) TaxID=521011 RepID=B8GFT7_METPE|nr:hybrid sensor histidine kinase/response regulator [Methanosphaerula palustris]ACL17970.1 hypothetical protein Mpal_2706 [Methanosphaerula palustris E1-9c]